MNNAAFSHAGNLRTSLEEIGKSGLASGASLNEVRTIFETHVFGGLAVMYAQLVLGVPPSVAELPRFSPLLHFCESEHLSRSPETTVNDLVDQNHSVGLYSLSEILREKCGCLEDDLLFLFCGNDTLGKFVVGEWHFDAPVV
jgi:hypothetical protein